MDEMPSRKQLRHTRPAAAERGWIYRNLGVEPIVNCAGTLTNYGGSRAGERVASAMAAAAEAFVDLDELAEAIGRSIADLTGAQWGIIASSSTAALALATAACLAGNDPELIVQLPNLRLSDRCVLLPAQHRFPYEGAMRTAGADLRTFDDVASLQHMLARMPRMICVLGRADLDNRGPSLDEIRTCAGATPIVVDAAGLPPASPDPWLGRGADLVIYSGGKYLAGPASTGILLGNQTLCRAAWINGPPHHALGRTMKIGREEMVGAVAALEEWLTARSESTDESAWGRTLDAIAQAAIALGLTTERIPPSHAVPVPRLRLTWRGQGGLTADEIRAAAFASHRVLFKDFRSAGEAIEIDPFNLREPEDADAVVRALQHVFRPRQLAPKPNGAPRVPETDLSGNWAVDIDFLGRRSKHAFALEQHADTFTGMHHGRESAAPLTGRIDSSGRVRLEACHRRLPMDLYYSFRGQFRKGQLSGDVFVGAAADEHRGALLCAQFGRARWHAIRLPSAGAAARDLQTRMLDVGD